LLIFVPTPLGNLEDITFRALNALKEADIVLCEDTRVARKLLKLLAQKLEMSFGDKEFVSFHEHNQRDFLKKISPGFFSKNVVHMSDAGMPGISDPGSELVAYAQEHGIPYTVLPGPTAFVTAYVASGFGSREFCFFGFLPHKGKERSEALRKILEQKSDAILYEAPHRLLRLLEEIVSIDPNRELFLAKELTKMHERYYKGSAAELLKRFQSDSIKGEWVVVIRGSLEMPKELRLTQKDILALPLPKKEKAKLLARISDKSVKEWYATLNDS